MTPPEREYMAYCPFRECYAVLGRHTWGKPFSYACPRHGGVIAEIYETAESEKRFLAWKAAQDNDT